MYRIIFDPKTALWVVELCKFHAFWKRIVGKEFATLKEAETYSKQVGLDQAYKRQMTMEVYSGHVPRQAQPTYQITQPAAFI